MPIFKRFLLVFISIFFIVLFAYPKTLLAQDSDQISPWYNPSFVQWSTKVFDDNPAEIFGERYTYAQVVWIVYSLGALVTGSDVLKCAGLASQESAEQAESCIESLAPQPNDTTDEGFAPAPKLADVGPLGFFANMSDKMIAYKPASGVEYIANTLDKFELLPSAYAQEGFGFTSLEPILVVWRTTRNIAYVLLVFVIIAMAFMIMFKVKISPQTVITVQSALPRIAIAIILITFSYAIAGLIIDLSYLVVGLIATFAKSGGMAATLIDPQTGELSTLNLFTRLLGFNASPVLALSLILLFFALLIIPVGGLIGAPFGGPVGVVGGLIVGAIIFLLIAFALLIVAIRIWWLQLRTLINILLLIIAAPLLILIGSISPSSAGFGRWVRLLVSNIAVYLVIITMFLLAHYFYWAFVAGTPAGGIASSDFFNPYQIGQLGTGGRLVLPGFNTGASLGLIGFMLAFGILLIIPQAGNLLRSILSGQPFNFGAAIGQSMGPITGVARSGQRIAGDLGRAYGTGRVITALPQSIKYKLPKNLREQYGASESPRD